jgi:hypothetical protein
VISRLRTGKSLTFFLQCTEGELKPCIMSAILSTLLKKENIVWKGSKGTSFMTLYPVKKLWKHL